MVFGVSKAAMPVILLLFLGGVEPLGFAVWAVLPSWRKSTKTTGLNVCTHGAFLMHKNALHWSA